MATLPAITVENLTMAYGPLLVMQDLNFSVKSGEIFFIMGGSGCGKSTLLRHMLGLLEPKQGSILYGQENFTQLSQAKRSEKLKNFGVLYQGGALWSSYTLQENVALPLQQHTDLSDDAINDIARIKLALVGLQGFEDYMPASISGGMRKRAGLARAMALDPEILFFDEPSAGLDPITSKKLDDLTLNIRDTLGTTIVIVSHELPSILSIADSAIYLDTATKTLLEHGDPKELRTHSKHEVVRNFLNRA